MADSIHLPEEFQAMVQPLIGLTVALPWQGYGSAIFLELGRLSPLVSTRQKHKKGEACIYVEWDWRVENGTSVLYGSSNSGPQIKRGIASLLGTVIESISVDGNIPELVVQFSNGHCLRSMVMVTGDPEWSIRLPGGHWLSSKAGKLLVGDGASHPPSEEELSVFALAKNTADRWGVPRAEPVQGECFECSWYVPIDGEAYLLEFGVCASRASAFDGRVVNCDSGCPHFEKSHPGGF